MKTHLYRVVILRGRVEKGMPGMLAAGQRPHKLLVLTEGGNPWRNSVFVRY